MYMNAITVNYAEVGDDHLPKSFGLVRNSDLDNQTVYNSNITEITGTNYSILQSRDIGTKDIIVSSNPKIDRLLSTFTPGIGFLGLTKPLIFFIKMTVTIIKWLKTKTEDQCRQNMLLMHTLQM